MKAGLLTSISLGLTFAAISPAADTPEAHIAAARAAAGTEHKELFTTVCTPDADSRPLPADPSDRAKWHVEPAKVFDNLYFVGESEFSAWAVNTSDGIILVDALFAYSVEDEIVNGLKKVGLDPAKIKYVIISHAHSDHAGGAKYLQDHFGSHIILSPADWDLLDRDKGSWPKPKRDMVATDGQKLTLGDTTVTLYLTPGHTYGTISTLIPVKDGGQPHLAATWGGTRSTGCDRRRNTSPPPGPRVSGSKHIIAQPADFAILWRARAPTCSSRTTQSTTARNTSSPRWPSGSRASRILT
jgi:Zn-dependent hydrolases, including glyoxylases